LQDAIITSSQLRAARAALGLTFADLAKGTGIGLATLKRYENAAHIPASKKNNLSALVAFYASAGIAFIGTPDDRPGIRIGRPTTQQE
jgi:transcriptional regulator with XRE-family HTH domain